MRWWPTWLGGRRVVLLTFALFLAAALAAAVTVAMGALITGDTPLALPMAGNPTTVLHLMPVLGAVVVGFPLVDRWPELTLLSQAPPACHPALRLGGCVTAALPVPVALGATGWTAAGASVVLGFVGVVALVVPLLRLWYWAPMLVVIMAWVRLRDPHRAVVAGEEWWAVSLAALALGGGAYVIVETVRLRRARTAR